MGPAGFEPYPVSVHQIVKVPCCLSSEDDTLTASVVAYLDQFPISAIESAPLLNREVPSVTGLCLRIPIFGRGTEALIEVLRLLAQLFDCDALHSVSPMLWWLLAQQVLKFFFSYSLGSEGPVFRGAGVCSPLFIDVNPDLGAVRLYFLVDRFKGHGALLWVSGYFVVAL
jgi:hypothetical protein